MYNVLEWYTVPISRDFPNIWNVPEWMTPWLLMRFPPGPGSNNRNLSILIVKPRLPAAYKKAFTTKAERHTNVEIINYLSDFERAQQDFSSSEFNLDMLITKSNIDLNSWRNYLENEKVSFTTLKKRIRINYAQRLLAGDFLDQYTVEYLTQTIGYQSRTSFYTAYKEITGKSFTERDAPQKDL